MERDLVISLINNASLLLMLSVVYEVAYFIPAKLSRFRTCISGVLIAAICIAIMSVPFTLQPGVVYDTRSILISVTGLMFGTVPVIITSVTAIIYRLVIGGAGSVPGLAVIITSALIGIFWRQWIYPRFRRLKWLSVYVMSLGVHATMIACMILLPYPDNLNVIRQIWLPVMLIYPVASVFLNLILMRQQEVRRTQHDLKKSEERYRQITENISDVVWTTDLNMNTTFVSPSIERLIGESIEDHLKRDLDEKFPPDSLAIINNTLQDELVNDDKRDKGRSRVIELEHYRADGSVIWLGMNISIIRDKDDRPIGFLGVSRDITMLKKTQSELQYMIDHDDLTGLYNRRRYEKEIRRMDIESQLPLTVVIVDINGLKLINDSFGHAEGDKIISVSAGLISGFCREGDFLARTGGDEFSILLPKTDSKDALKFIESVLRACDLYNREIENEAYHINLAFGTETKRSSEEDFTLTCRRAEDYLNQSKLLKKSSSNSAVIASIRATMQEKSHETEAHSERIAHFAKKVGAKLDLSQIELDHIELLATLHDIGKVGIAERILMKPGKLDPDEWKEMKKHPEIGYRIAMSSPNLAPIAEYILCHHERWDGSGYPRGLKGKNIPLISRIISIADSFDAMTEDRIYRKAMSKDEAIEEIRKCSGTQFDPDIAQIFIEEVG